jgi:hypothetical protein
MVTTRTNPNAPITFPGQIKAYSKGDTYTARKITPSIAPDKPLKFSKAEVRYTSPGGDPSVYTNA